MEEETVRKAFVWRYAQISCFRKTIFLNMYSRHSDTHKKTGEMFFF